MFKTGLHFMFSTITMSTTSRFNRVAGIVLTLIVVINLNGSVGADNDGNFNVGVGIADVTGPSADIGMMGYASPTQSARGIHTRLFARAFVFESDGQRVVYVSADIGMVDQAIKTQVMIELKARFGDEYFTPQNVLLSGTHTHSGPAGYIQYLLYGITSLGFNHVNFRAIVSGIVQSIERANADLQPGKIFFNKGELLEANINRSPTSYLANPAEEREQYDHDVDKDMTLLRIESQDGKKLGSINWFAVHPTSMNNTNLLISGDNKGYAAMRFEQKMNPSSRPGKGKFVAAFGSSNLGDVSPNTMGPRCVGGPDIGKDCEPLTSTCNGYTTYCIAFGPGKNYDMEESTQIIGERQFSKAAELFDDPTAEMLSGPIQFKHQYVNMTNFEVTVKDNVTGEMVKKTTCKAALGYSFAGGTTDGPGAFDFTQGMTSGNVFWDFIKDFIVKPSEEMVECQWPKPILLAVGEAYWPYEWVPSIVETQILRIGNLYIIGIPGELTTMAGRRLRKVVEESVRAKNPPGSPEPHVVIAGLSNVYTHYISTYEEYQRQRYEAASTIYGPHTLDAYLQHYPTLVDSMLDGTTIDVGPSPPNLIDQQLSLMTPIVVDTVPFLHDFGDVLAQPNPTVTAGNVVSTKFVAGHPRNNAMREGTFFLIERQVDQSSRWEIVQTDADWDTKFRWRRPSLVSYQNEIEITWKTSLQTTPGIYRIRHFGYYKPAGLDPRPYQGSTATFQIITSKYHKPKEHPLWDPNPKPTKNIRTVREFWNALVARHTAPVYKSNIGSVHPSMPDLNA